MRDWYLLIVAALSCAVVMLLGLVWIGVAAAGETFGEEFSRPHQATIAYSASSPVAWTGWNRFWFSAAVGGQAADAATTVHALDGGCRELNPILGSDPSPAAIVAFKLGVMGLAWLITERWTPVESRQSGRNWVYGALGVAGMGAAAWNSCQDCD